MKKRHGVLGLLCVMSVITFLDRLAIPVAEPGIRGDLHLSPSQWGWVLSAYVLANALFEIPSGARGDRRGQRSGADPNWGVVERVYGGDGVVPELWTDGWIEIFVWDWGGGGVSECGGGDFAVVSEAGARPGAGVCVGCEPAGGGRWLRCCWCRLHGTLDGGPCSGCWGGLGIVWSVCWWGWFRDEPEEMAGITATELVGDWGGGPAGAA